MLLTIGVNFFRGQLIKFERYDDDSDDEFFLWYGWPAKCV